MFWLDIVRFGIGILAYGIASVLDIKTRRVPNALWTWLIVASLLSFAVGFFYYSGAAIGLSLILAFVVSLVCLVGFKLRVWGGADAKGVMCLTLLVPGVFPVHGVLLPLSVIITALALGVAAVLAMFKAEKHKPFMPSLFVGFVVIMGWVVL